MSGLTVEQVLLTAVCAVSWWHELWCDHHNVGMQEEQADLKYPQARDYLNYVKWRQTVHFKKLDNPKVSLCFMHVIGVCAAAALFASHDTLPIAAPARRCQVCGLAQTQHCVQQLLVRTACLSLCLCLRVMVVGHHKHCSHLVWLGVKQGANQATQA